MVGTFFLNSLYLQNALDWSPLESGFAFMPLVLAIGLAAHLAPRLLAHAGSRAVAVTGLALLAAGALLLTLAPDHASYAGDLLPGFLLLGLGLGLVFPTASVTAMSEIHAEHAGLASGLMSTAHELGAALGVAVLSAVAASAPDAAAGYNEGFLVATGIAAGLAALALVAVPTMRPAPDVRPATH
jgi:fucose permease